MKRFYIYLKKTGKIMWVALLLSLLVVAFQTASALMVKTFVKSYDGEEGTVSFAVSLIVYACFLGAFILVRLFWTKSLDVLGGKVLKAMREDMFDALNYAPYKNIMETGSEKIRNIIYSDSIQAFSSLSVLTIDLLTEIILLCVFETVAFVYMPLLGGFLLVIACVGFLISFISRKHIRNASMKVNKKMKADNKIIGEYVDSIEMVRTNGLLNYFKKKESDAIDEFIKTSLKADDIIVTLKNLVSFFHKWATLLVTGIVIIFLKSEVADIVFIMMILDVVMDASTAIESSIFQIMRNKPSFENISGLIDLIPDERGKSISQIEQISFENVKFSYGENAVLKGVSFDFKKGDIVRIEGENGSGKTTLTKMITGLIKPDDGVLRINNENINEISVDSLCDDILYLAQDEVLINEGVMDYLFDITRNDSREERLQCIKKVGIDEKTMITELGASLSGGQKKKMLLAKFLAAHKNRTVLILDEPESNLDSETLKVWEDIRAQLVNEREKHIVFYISHEVGANGFENKRIKI